MELLVEDGEEGHRSIEVLLLLVEVQVHDTEVDLQLGRVLLLLEELHLCFDLLLSFLALELLLGESRVLFLLLVLFLLFFINFLLLSF